MTQDELVEVIVAEVRKHLSVMPPLAEGDFCLAKWAIGPKGVEFGSMQKGPVGLEKARELIRKLGT